MHRFLRDQSLTIVTLALTGYRVYNAERVELGEAEVLHYAGIVF